MALAPPAVARSGPTPPGEPFPGQGGGRPEHPRRTSQGPEPFAPAFPQALSLKESEKTALSEKLMGTQHSLAAVSLEMERQKRDAQSRQEQDRVGRGAGGGRGGAWPGGGQRTGRGGGRARRRGPGRGAGYWRRSGLGWSGGVAPGGVGPGLGGVTVPCGSFQAVREASPFLGGPHWRERAQLGPVNP